MNEEEETFTLDDLDPELKQRIEEAIRLDQEESHTYKLCSQDLLDYSLYGISSIRD